MNFFKLRIFVVVCTTRSFTKAAEELFITQSAVSKSIKELESTWEIKLIIRKGNQIDITEEGKNILVYALNLLNEYASLESALKILKGEKKEKIKIGSGGSITKLILENVTRYFFENYPNVELDLHSGNSASAEYLLKTGNLDYGIVTSTLLDPELIYLPVYDDVIWPVCHKDHPLATKKILLKDILAYPIFSREKGSATQDAVTNYFSSKGLQFPVKNSVNYNEALLSYFIMEKEHIGFISETEISQKPLWKEVKKLSLKEGPIKRKIYLAYRKSNFEPLLLKEIQQAIACMKISWEG